MDEKLVRLKDLTLIQTSYGNWNYNEYMRGMANGMILAVAIMEDKEPKYFDEPDKYECEENGERRSPEATEAEKKACCICDGTRVSKSGFEHMDLTAGEPCPKCVPLDEILKIIKPPEENQ